ncbi:hypothetical protein AA103196_0495 [Ameyamaea chiangmaiensis NBRC 103196]|nr:hypothetical protein AA103196_0495 [Ameyamaea chiangmaiensis NBRC 103196]
MHTAWRGGVGRWDVARTHAILADAWPWLGPAEAVMAKGGDSRLAVDPATGLNHYGCSHRPRPWAITFASSTASSISERGYAGAEAARRRLILCALRDGWHPGAMALTDDVRARIGRHFGVDAAHVVLAPSGTDCELVALALARRHGRPVTNVLIAAEETGSGVPLAAAGRHFSNETARGAPVGRGRLLDGIDTAADVYSVPIRTDAGCERDPAAIDAECMAIVRAQQAAARHVLIHRLDLSKTGLLAPGLACLKALGGTSDVVVDACQARIDPERVRDYLDRGWMVMVTGSKFYTGPPFAGALLLPPALAAALRTGPMPPGLGAYVAPGDWPGRGFPPDGPANVGLALRWAAACAEMDALTALPRATVRDRIDGFIGAMRSSIATRPSFRLLPTSAPDRPWLPDAWDDRQTIVSFLVGHGTEDGWRPLDLAAARSVYRWLNADLAPVLRQHGIAASPAIASRLCHIGQPVPVPAAGAQGGIAGALRMSAGARLVSGEPSHAGLAPQTRLAREHADARLVLDKIDLILTAWDVLQAADPAPGFMPADRTC